MMDFDLSTGFRSPIWAGFTLVASIVAFRYFQVASRVVDSILRRKYPIHHASSNEDLPTTPFILPNGQGNVEKFLNGQENSVKWGSQFGPVYRIWSGFQGEVVLTRPSDIEVVFRDSHSHQKAPSNNSGHLMNLLLGSCVGLISGSEWQNVRRATEQHFLRPSAKALIPRVLANAKTYISTMYSDRTNEKWEKSTDERPGREWNLHPVVDLKNYPFLVVAEVLYGPLSDDLQRRLIALIPGRVKVFNQVIQGGISRFQASRALPLRIHREIDAFKVEWARWNDDAHAAAILSQQQHDGKASKTEMTQLRPAILDMYKSVAEGLATQEHILQTLDEMLFANLDVTMGGISWPLIFLAAHMDVQNTLRREIASISPETEGEMERYILSQDTYLHHVILEAARLRPLVPFSIPQSCPTPRLVSGYKVPAGTNFIVDTHALNIRDPAWGPDNTCFRPERWRGISGKESRYRYWRFGFGPRLCLGKHVADVMIKALIYELVQRSELVVGENDEWRWDEECWINHPAMEIKCVNNNESSD
ncbi:unnamed protein product [Periconia digitata]|uniref:Cytochrome P450 n=1 Tax=Periconia digitata TaxID=1303443 RepID=A0A9W4XQU3_9PLEO|nr:unnamed protein product [Periconia digitata]